MTNETFDLLDAQDFTAIGNAGNFDTSGLIAKPPTSAEVQDKHQDSRATAEDSTATLLLQEKEELDSLRLAAQKDTEQVLAKTNALIQHMTKDIDIRGIQPINPNEIRTDKRFDIRAFPDLLSDQNLIATLLNRQHNECQGVLVCAPLTNGDQRRFAVSGIRDVIIGQGGIVEVEQPDLAAHEIEFHTHTPRNRDFLGTVSNGDIVAALESEGVTNPDTKQHEPHLRRFAVMSLYEDRKGRRASLQIYELDVEDMHTLARFGLLEQGGYGLRKLGSPLVFEV